MYQRTWYLRAGVKVRQMWTTAVPGDIARRLELCEILFNASYRQANFRRKPFARYFREITKQLQNLSHIFSHIFLRRNPHSTLQSQLNRIT